MIEGIKEFSAKRQHRSFAQSADFGGFRQGSIEVGLMRSPEGGTSGAAIVSAISDLGKWAAGQIGYRSIGKRGGVEITVKARFDTTAGGHLGLAKSRTELGSRGTCTAENASTDWVGDRQRQAALEGSDTREGPAAKQLAVDEALPGRMRNLPKIGEDETLGTIEVGRPPALMTVVGSLLLPSPPRNTDWKPTPSTSVRFLPQV